MEPLDFSAYHSCLILQGVEVMPGDEYTLRAGVEDINGEVADQVQLVTPDLDVVIVAKGSGRNQKSN